MNPALGLPLTPGGWQLVMADPPWQFKTRSPKGITRKGAEGQYRCMSLAQIRAMNVGLYCDRNALLFLWATNPMLPQAFDVLSAWGFRFSTAGTWAKIDGEGRVQRGTGMRLACSCEPFLIGIKGNVPVPERSIPNLIVAPRREHSRKPEEAYAMAERMHRPDVRRLDLFTRQIRPGWTPHGDEADKFGEVRA